MELHWILGFAFCKVRIVFENLCGYCCRGTRSFAKDCHWDPEVPEVLTGSWGLVTGVINEVTILKAEDSPNGIDDRPN